MKENRSGEIRARKDPQPAGLKFIQDFNKEARIGNSNH